jgi:hypothetical protein
MRGDWWNMNANRSYPFVKKTVDLPGAASSTIESLTDSVIVDCGFVMGLSSQFDTAAHEVYLYKISRQGSNFEFDFRSSAPGLFERSIVFSRQVGDEDNLVEHLDNFQDPFTSDSASASASASESDSCDAEPLWAGFLVTGSIAELEELLPGDGALTRASIGGQVEPSLLTSLVGSYVDSINLANNDRTRIDAPDGCPDIEFPGPVNVVHTHTECIRGDVKLKPGYNIAIRQDGFTNTISIEAEPGSGEGEACEEVPLYPTEAPPDGSQLFEGGPLCGELIRSINGLGGKVTRLLGGTGVDLELLPAESKIVVDVSMNQLAICFEDLTDSE